MGTRTGWIVALVVVAAGMAFLRARTARSNGVAPVSEPRTEPRASEPETEVGMRPAPRQPSAPSEPPTPQAQGPAASDARSPLARELDEVAASFLTEQPRAADLLRRIHELAAVAVVEPESVELQRDEEAALRSVRGTLSAGDLRATFLIEEHGFHVTFSGAVGEAPWMQRDLQISFQDDPAGAANCHATVQFQPLGASATEAAGERIAGWSLRVSPETGSQAQALTVAAVGGEWRIGDGSSVPPQELPWLSQTGAFDAWLRLLRPYAER